MEPKQIDLYEFLVESELQQYYNSIKNELKISNASHLKYATDEDLKQIGLSRPEIRRLRKFYEKYYPHGYLSKIKRLLQNPTNKKDDGFISNQVVSNEPMKTTNSPSKTPSNKHIIPADSICVNKQLGTGEFGIVQQGVWTNGAERIQVAIKCLCRERMQSNPMEFLKEAAIMHAIEHENIVRLYGVVLDTDSLMLVTELAHLRSLLECLKDSGLRVNFLTVPTLCEFAQQICNGMMYLENKRLIHRDLAARNILVFSKNKVKISDFGLSRALGVGKDYYKTNFNVNLKLPIAWCAPECINFLRFTNASDVWAYGVCLWEMFSYGFQPWAALTGLQILDAIDEPNYQRLEQPECCPREYYSLMLKCWQHDPSKRPKFSEIYQMLPDMKPEQLKTIVSNCEPKKDHLLYRQGEIITVLDKITNAPYWKGVLNSGKTGFFNPANTVAYLEGLPSSTNRDSFCRTNDRSSKRKLRTEMISSPQNDLKHTGHVGLDGAYFGDVAFIASSQNYNRLPRQIVTPYKPSEDIEQTPLLLPPTPTSPDSLQTASGYFPEDLTTSSTNPTFINSNENTPKHHQTNSFGSSFDFSLPSKTAIFNSSNPFAPDSQSSNAANSFALQNNNYGLEANAFTNANLIDDDTVLQNNPLKNLAVKWSESDKTAQTALNDVPQHEYHEISDDEITAEKVFDLGPSLLDEINSMFGSITTATATTTSLAGNTMNSSIELSSELRSPSSADFDHHTNKKNEITELTSKFNKKNDSGNNANGNKTNRKNKTQSGTVKPISVKDEKILNQAIEIANEISARSMTDLVNDHPTQMTQSPKRKFSFRFPNLSHHNSIEKEGHHHHQNSNFINSNFSNSTNTKERKNFSEELRNIPDLQSSITEEHREAYNSLIERKTSSSTLVGKFDTNEFKLTTAKTLPRKFITTSNSTTTLSNINGSNTTKQPLTSASSSSSSLSSSLKLHGNDHLKNNLNHLIDDLTAPTQPAPRPTTLPNRGGINKIKKTDNISCESNPLRILRDKNYPIIRSRQKILSTDENLSENVVMKGDVDNENVNPQKMISNNGEKDSICESPSYLTNTLYTFPDNSNITMTATTTVNKNATLDKGTTSSTITTMATENCNPIPLPPRDRNKIMQTNVKRHVRKHPLIIPGYGVQRTLNKVTEITPVDDQQKFEFPFSSATSTISTNSTISSTLTSDTTTTVTNAIESQVDKNLNHLSPDKYSAHTIKIPGTDNSESNIKALKITQGMTETMKNSSLILPLSSSSLSNRNQHINSKVDLSKIDKSNSNMNQNDINKTNENNTIKLLDNQYNQRTYENVDNIQMNLNEYQRAQNSNNSSNNNNNNNNNNTDSASLHFELILEDNFNKVDIVSSPDAIDGLCPFAIRKDHYNKQNDINFNNCTNISGLYVNEDELLRNLDIEKKRIEFIQKHPQYLEPKNELADNALFNKVRENVNLSMQQGNQKNSSSINNGNSNSNGNNNSNNNNNNSNNLSSNSNDITRCNDRKLASNNSNNKNKSMKHGVQVTDLDADDNDDDNDNNDDDKNVKSQGNSAINSEEKINDQSNDNNNVDDNDNDDGHNARPIMGDCNSVSCEDLLEFSDIKPKGYERGVDSDEVRIMLKVLGKDVLPERCLKTLEFIEWDVHRAIKIIKLQNILSTVDLSLKETVDALKNYDWDLQITTLKLKGVSRGERFGSRSSSTER